MKFGSFSDAIRAGAKLRPQASQLFEKLPDGSIGSCAVGAGYEAITGDVDLRRSQSIYDAVARLYPYMGAEAWSSCPVVECEEPPLGGLDEVVLHLNDDHKWTREQIADWLQTEEDKLGYVTIVEPVEAKEVVQV